MLRAVQACRISLHSSALVCKALSVGNNSIQFSSLLFMCRVNSQTANYIHSTQTQHKIKDNHRTLGVSKNIVNNFRLSRNLTERNGSECKHVEIFTHGVGSIGAQSSGQYLLEGQTPNNWKEHES
jgi:hypothetical protein